MKKYSEAQKTLEELQKSQPTPPASASNTKDTESQKIVVLPRERWLKKFGGRRTDAEQTVEDFVDDLKAAMSAREMSRGEKLDFVKSHLEGAAREEVRLFPKEALRWSEEEEKPWRSTHESASREVMSDVVESKECNSSTASTPLQQVLDALLKQQQSTEDLTKTMQAMRSVE